VTLPDVRERRFSIIGAARSGLAVARLLKRRGASVFLSERSPAEAMKEAAAALAKEKVPAEFGGHTGRVLEADTIVLSPGVPSETPIVVQALESGKAVVSELEVASWFCPAPIVAITGTNGKTTTTTLAGRIFEDAKRPSVTAGNIGRAFAEVVEGLTERHVAILEVSSFQLDYIASFRPEVAVILNITPDHLDRYGHSFEKYIAAKCRVFENQRGGDVVIYSYDDDITRDRVQRLVPAGVTLLPFSIAGTPPVGALVRNGRLTTIVRGQEADVIGTGEISIRGGHNLANAMAASLVAKVMGIPTASLRATLRNFKGVEHRLEFVRELDGVTFVNDSKATNVDSVWYALQSFPQPMIVLMGGRDKGNDYARLYELVRKHVKSIVAIGESADKVVGAFADLVPVKKAASMEDAVRVAAGEAAAGDVVLLSPACASFDWFENYEHRGRVFKELVMKLRSIRP